MYVLLCWAGSLVEHKYDAASLENVFWVNYRNRGICICQVEDLSLFKDTYRFNCLMFIKCISGNVNVVFAIF